jgi:DNA-binding NarL/FixJ family response regulator
MHLSIRAVDKIRDRLFLKLDVRNRTALAVKALKEGIIV